MVVRRGYREPPSLHIERLRAAPPGHFFDVITNGFGAMPDYRAQIPPADRWAIVAYVRALQLSQHAPAEAAALAGGAPGGPEAHR
jgi:mono/diheme cytochrome c family protein